MGAGGLCIASGAKELPFTQSAAETNALTNAAKWSNAEVLEEELIKTVFDPGNFEEGNK